MKTFKKDFEMHLWEFTFALSYVMAWFKYQALLAKECYVNLRKEGLGQTPKVGLEQTSAIQFAGYQFRDLAIDKIREDSNERPFVVLTYINPEAKTSTFWKTIPRHFAELLAYHDAVVLSSQSVSEATMLADNIPVEFAEVDVVFKGEVIFRNTEEWEFVHEH